MKVQDIMTKNVAFISPGTNAAIAAEIMWNQNCGALPVVEDGGRLAGIVTDRDLFIALGTSNRNPSDLPVYEVINHQSLATCMPEDDVRTALATMAGRKVRRLLVVDEGGSLQGILSMDDIAMRTEGDGLSTNDVLATLKSIWSRQFQSKAGELQTSSKSRRSAA